MSRDDTNADTGYRRLWRDWLSPYRGLILLSVVFLVVAAFGAAGYSKAVQLIIQAYETADTSVIYWGPLSIIALSMTKGLSNYIRIVAASTAFSRLEADLQEKMYQKLLFADLSRLQSDTPAALAMRFSSDTQLVRLAVEAALEGLSSVLIIVATVAIMMSIDWQVTLVLVLVFSGAVVPVNLIGTRVRRITGSSQDELSRMNSDIVEGLSGIRMARTYQLENRLARSAADIFARLRDLKIHLAKWNARLSPIMEILSGLAIAVLLVIVSWRISRGTMSIADFMGLLTGVSVISQPARKIGATFSAMMQGRVALGRLYTILDSADEIVDAPDARQIAQTTGRLSFDHVGFRYPNGFEALSDINLDIPAGSRVAFVGRSGAGKSTVFNLIPRLFDTTSGRVLLDGTDIRDITLDSLRRQIAVVSQDAVLLAGTVGENIGFGRPDATPDEIRAAAKAAAADGFISKLPQGYDTPIDPAGDHFSGGEKQRLSIARAILRDAPVLLLDEPTSALDAESEAAIRKALEQLAAGRTTLVIAHRLATILDSDMIVVMDQGRIVETGTHEELRARNGIYAELYRLQFSGA